MDRGLLTARFAQPQTLSNVGRLTAENTLTEHLKSFLLYCRVKKLSKHTRNSYTYFIGSFVLFAERNNIVRLCDVNRMLIELFLVEIGETNSGTSCKDYFKALHRFFNWLMKVDKIIEHSPMDGIDSPLTDSKLVEPFNHKHIESLLQFCSPKCEIGLRNRALIMVLYYSAARRREIADMKVEDVDIEQQVIKIMGKNRSERLVTINEKTAGLIFEYLRTRKKKSEYLWLADNSQPLTPYGIYKIIHNLSVKAGIHGVRCSPHTFRYTRAVDLLNKDVAQKYVQKLLGHKDSRMTDHYLDSISSRVAVEKIKEMDSKQDL